MELIDNINKILKDDFVEEFCCSSKVLLWFRVSSIYTFNIYSKKYLCFKIFLASRVAWYSKSVCSGNCANLKS